MLLVYELETVRVRRLVDPKHRGARALGEALKCSRINENLLVKIKINEIYFSHIYVIFLILFPSLKW